MLSELLADDPSLMPAGSCTEEAGHIIHTLWEGANVLRARPSRNARLVSAGQEVSFPFCALALPFDRWYVKGESTKLLRLFKKETLGFSFFLLLIFKQGLKDSQ